MKVRCALALTALALIGLVAVVPDQPTALEVVNVPHYALASSGVYLPPVTEIAAAELTVLEENLVRLEYLNAVYAAQLAAQEAESARVRAAQAYQAPARAAPAYNGVGECTGFSVPDYIIIRESGGNPEAHNPSGAHGCTQTLLSHYRDGGPCGGMDPYTIQGQRDCTYALSAGGTNLTPWSQTR